MGKAVDVLREWILSPEHIHFPYPTECEKKILVEKTGISSKQLKYWFVNARRRIWKQSVMEKKQNKNLGIVDSKPLEQHATFDNHPFHPNNMALYNTGLPQRGYDCVSHADSILQTNLALQQLAQTQYSGAF